MKKTCKRLLPALLLVLVFSLAGYAGETIGDLIPKLRDIESQGDLYHLALEKLRTLNQTVQQDLLDLPQEEILWLISYGLDMHDHMLYSFVGESERKAQQHDAKLREFTGQFDTIWKKIDAAYERPASSEEKKAPPVSDKFFDILKKGESALGLLPLTSEGLKFTWDMVQKWLADREKKDEFIAELKGLRKQHAALLENAPDSPWSFALLSYARLQRQSTEYIKHLNQLETAIDNLSIPYEKTRALNDGILSIKQKLALYDNKIKRAIIDVPVFTIQFYATTLIESAKGAFRNDKETILEAAVLFARTAGLINLAVDDAVRKGWTDTAKELESLLSAKQYEEVKGKSRTADALREFEDMPQTIRWP